MSNIIDKKIRVAISVGDTNGIGLEVILKSLENKEILDFFTPIIFGSTKLISYYKNITNINIQAHGINHPKDALNNKINVVNLWQENTIINPGKSTPEGGKYAFESLKSAADAVKNGDADVLVTAPINKDNIQSDDFRFPGHTEYLEHVWGGKSLMFMVHESLKVGLVTQHIPLLEVSDKITKNGIIQKAKSIAYSLKVDFGVNRPKIAVLGLNPHASDNGLLGNEEEKTILPAILQLQKEGIVAFGAFSADSFFSPQNRGAYDAVLAMYHDQGLIPFKTLTFGEGVNFTAGLPFIRTSPDHGVAYDLVGKNKANHESFNQAIFEAIKIYKNRTEYLNLIENKIKIKNTKHIAVVDEDLPLV